MKIAMALIGLLLAIQIEASSCNGAKVTYDISTGSKTGTYYQIGLNLAKYIAPQSCIKLNVLNSNGSMDNVFKLISANNIKFAIVQNDVLQELKRLAKIGNKKAKKLVKNLRVITPLYNEEIHIIAKAGSDIKTFANLKGKTISIGKQKSGTAMTSYLLYKELFGTELKNAKTQKFDDALRDLQRGTVDAIIKVGGQPVLRLSKDMTKDSAKYIKLLSYNEKDDNQNPIESYYTADIKSSSYPWLEEDVPTLSTKAFLITYNYRNLREKTYIKKFIKSLKDNLPSMQKNATKALDTPHLKWKEVTTECNPALPGGWKYYDGVNEICGKISRTNETKTSKASSSCSQRDKALGLCQ